MSCYTRRIEVLGERIAQAEDLLDCDIKDGAWYRLQDELEMMRLEMEALIEAQAAWHRRVAESTY